MSTAALIRRVLKNPDPYCFVLQKVPSSTLQNLYREGCGRTHRMQFHKHPQNAGPISCATLGWGGLAWNASGVRDGTWGFRDRVVLGQLYIAERPVMRFDIDAYCWPQHRSQGTKEVLVSAVAHAW